MSEIQKCPNLVRGGGSTFFKNVPNSKMSQMSEGGGSTLIGTFPKFSPFSILTPPLVSTCVSIFQQRSMASYKVARLLILPTDLKPLKFILPEKIVMIPHLDNHK